MIKNYYLTAAGGGPAPWFDGSKSLFINGNKRAADVYAAFFLGGGGSARPNVWALFDINTIIHE
jgi:hypothetical protein